MTYLLLNAELLITFSIGVAGCGLLYVYTPENFRGTLGALSIHKDISAGIGCAVEITLTFQLIWTVMASTDPIKKFTGFQAPLAIGLSVGIGLLVGVSFSLIFFFCIQHLVMSFLIPLELLIIVN